MRASKSLNSDALQRRLHYHSAWLRTTQARSTSSRRGDFSWGAAPNPECKQVSCGFSSVRGVGRSPTLKIRALRNMLIGSTARSMRRSGNGMRPSRSDRVARRSEATEPRSGCKGPRHLCEPSELTQTRTEVQYDEIHRCAPFVFCRRFLHPLRPFFW